MGGTRVRVPVFVNRETTIEIARRVNARLAEIEKDSDRVDTYHFALRAALSFAAELDGAQRAAAAEIEQTKRTAAAEIEQIEQERQDETQEMFAALDTISDALRSILKTLRGRADSKG